MSGCLDCGTGSISVGKHTLPDGRIVDLFICDWCYDYHYIENDKIVILEWEEVFASSKISHY